MNAGEWKEWPEEKPARTDHYFVRKDGIIESLYYDSKEDKWRIRSERYFELNEFQRSFLMLNQNRFLWLKPE